MTTKIERWSGSCCCCNVKGFHKMANLCIFHFVYWHCLVLTLCCYLLLLKKFGPITVEIKSLKSKASASAEAAPKPVDLNCIANVDPLHQGQALLAAGKKRKKQQKRAGLYMFPIHLSILIWKYGFIKQSYAFITIWIHTMWPFCTYQMRPQPLSRIVPGK